MSLDDDVMTNAEAVHRGREHDLALLRAEWEEQALCESPEAMESYWSGRFRQSREHWTGSEHWDGTT